VVYIDNALLCKFKEYIDIQKRSSIERSPKMTTIYIEEDVRFIDVFVLQNAFIIQKYKRV